MSDLDTRLLAAHAQNDSTALIALYTEAGAQASEEIACGFYLTHAFIFALEAGDSRAKTLHAQLKSMGRV